MKPDALQPIREALYVGDTDRDATVLADMIRDLFRTESKRCDENRALRAENARLRAALEHIADPHRVESPKVAGSSARTIARLALGGAR